MSGECGSRSAECRFGMARGPGEKRTGRRRSWCRTAQVAMAAPHIGRHTSAADPSTYLRPSQQMWVPKNPVMNLTATYRK